MHLFCRPSFRPLLRQVVVMAGAGMLAGLVACSRQAAARPVAMVGEVAITREDVLREAERLRRSGRPVPDKETLLQELVLHEAMVQRARKQGLHLDPGLRRELDNLLIGRLQDQELAPRLAALTVDRSEVEAEYRRCAAEFTRPAKVRLAMIYLKEDRQASESKRQELRVRMAEARARALAHPASGGRGGAAGGFGAVATEFSEDQASRYRGGDLGWMDAGTPPARLPQVVFEAGSALPAGEISPVMETEGGLYLVMKTDAREAHTLPLNSVEGSLRKRLLAAKRESATAVYHGETMGFVGIQTDREVLAALELPKGHPPAEPDSPPELPVASAALP